MTTKLSTKIVNAFKKIRLKPIRGLFVSKSDNKMCGCALTALYCVNKRIDLRKLRKLYDTDADDLVSDINEWAHDKFGNERDAIISGFDGRFYLSAGKLKEEADEAAKILFKETV